jgi:hypothetical protein
MGRLIVDHREVTGITPIEFVVRRKPLYCLLDFTHPAFVTLQLRYLGLEIRVGHSEEIRAGFRDVLAQSGRTGRIAPAPSAHRH